jgi:NADPH-dependent 2,4-dienoyl-CoA reductase/sulfur reductase-like enzyme
VQLRLGTGAKSLNRDGAGRLVETTGGEVHGERVVVAMGARRRHLPVPVTHDCVRTLRTLDEAPALRGRLRQRADAVGRPRDATDARRLLALGSVVDAARLPDPSVRLGGCLLA